MKKIFSRSIFFGFALLAIVLSIVFPCLGELLEKPVVAESFKEDSYFPVACDMAVDRGSRVILISSAPNGTIRVYEAMGYFVLGIARTAQSRYSSWTDRTGIPFSSSLPIGTSVGCDRFGSIYVANGFDAYSNIQIFSNTGLNKGEIKQGSFSSENTKVVRVDNFGQIYGLQESGRIMVFDTFGQFIRMMRVPTRSDTFNPSDMAIDKEGVIYVVDKESKSLVIFDDIGRLIKEVKEIDNISFDKIERVAVDYDGNIYLAGSPLLSSVYKDKGWINLLKLNSKFQPQGAISFSKKEDVFNILALATNLRGELYLAACKGIQGPTEVIKLNFQGKKK